MSINMSASEFRRRRTVKSRARFATGARPRPVPRYAAPSRQRRTPVAKELGYVDLPTGTFNCDTTGTISLVNTVAQGASINQRVGKRIHLKSLQLRGKVRAGTAGVINDATMLLVYDRRPTGSLPAITDILTAINSHAFNNDNNTDRFRIVRRWDWVLCGADAAGERTSASGYTFDHFVDLKNMPQVFKAVGTGAIGDIAEGAMYLVSVGDTGAGTSAPIGTVSARLRFIDA